MAEQTVILSPGESKVVSFEATPTKAKTYSVSVNGLTDSFVAKEVIVPWSFSNVKCWLSGSGVGAWQQVNFSATVTNVGNARVTKTVTQYRRDYRLMWSDETMSWYREWSSPKAIKSVTIALSPGASYNYTSPEKNLIADNEPAECWLEDSDGYKSATCTVTAHY